MGLRDGEAAYESSMTGPDGASPARLRGTGILPVVSSDMGWKPVPQGDSDGAGHSRTLPMEGG
jgi:hypothetical protein